MNIINYEKINSDFFDYNSVELICGNSNQVMVYGWSNCQYEEIADTLCEPDSPIKKVFSYKIGVNKPSEDPEDHKQRVLTYEGRMIEQIVIPMDDLPGADSQDEKMLNERDNRRKRRDCKGALVNIVLENFKRSREGLPLIKVIFITDRFDNKHSITPQTIASKDSVLTRKVTHGELRRCYKLACEQKNDALATIAKETFVFVHLIKAQGIYGLKPVSPFWANPEWAKAWSDRKAQPPAAQIPRTIHPWQKELDDRIAAYCAKNW